MRWCYLLWGKYIWTEPGPCREHLEGLRGPWPAFLRNLASFGLCTGFNLTFALLTSPPWTAKVPIQAMVAFSGPNSGEPFVLVGVQVADSE